MLALSFLGPFAAEMEGRPLLLRTNKVQALLVYLTVESALGRRTGVSRDVLMALLWPGMPEVSARQNLRQTIYLLRQVLPSVAGRDETAVVPFLRSDRQTVQINPEARFALDVAEFQRLLRDGSIAALEEAVTLYRGDFLADFYLDDSAEFEAWAAGHRGQLQRDVLQALERLAAHALSEMAYMQAEEYARRQLELDPLREIAYRQLMEALWRSGRRSAAIATFQQCQAVLETELGIQPATETQALYEQIRGEEWESAAAHERPVQHPSVLDHIHSPAPEPSLPHLLTSFFGREKELRQIKTWLLGADNRLVTLVGPGGSGKTRLAIEAGWSLQKGFANGVHFVSLAEIDDDDLFQATVTSALGVSLPPLIAPEQQLAHYLQNRELLLIVDNFEQSLPTARLIADWLKGAPGFRVLATSRERLGIYGESLLRVEGLEITAEPGAGIEKNPAIVLFLNRAQRVNPDLALTRESRAAIRRICRLLQGNPLAIELVAPWTRMLSYQAIEAQVRQSLDLFSDSPHDRPPRHRSLRALFDYAWNRLDTEEQSLLQELAVFRGEMSLEAAAQVTGITLATLASLVDKSLLTETEANRYEMHIHLRKYAREQPRKEPQTAAAVLSRHAAYYADFLGQRATSLEGGRVLPMVQEITREIDNIRAAWKWAAETQDGMRLLQMTIPLLLFYEIRGWYAEGSERFEMALALFSSGNGHTENDTGNLVRAYLLAGYGWFAHRLGRYQLTRRLLDESLALGKALGDTRLQAFVVSALALVDSRLGQVREAETRAAESLALAEKVADPLSRAFSLVNIGFAALFHGHYERAHDIYREALAAFRSFDNDYGAAICLVNLGHISMRLGDYDEAIESCRRASRLCESTGYQFGLGNTLRNLAEAYLAIGVPDEAEGHAVQSLKLAEEMGDREGYAWAVLVLGKVAEAQGEPAAAEKLFKQSHEIFAELNHTLGVAEASHEIGALALAGGFHRRAAEVLLTSLSFYGQIGHDEGLARSHSVLGEAYLQQGALEEARDHFQQSLILGRSVELPPLKVALLYRSAGLLLPDQPLSASSYVHLVATHPATEHRLRSEARKCLEELEAVLPTLPSAPDSWSDRQLDEQLERMLQRLEPRK